MRTRRRRINSDDLEIDLTPLIDVVFIMLIFFVTASSFVKTSTIPINRPEASTGTDSNTKKSLVITIDKEQQLYLNDKKVDLNALSTLIKEEQGYSKEDNVIVEADKGVQTGLTIGVVDEVRKSGLTNIAIATLK
jgi:biopolymer transport protein ExbD